MAGIVPAISTEMAKLCHIIEITGTSPVMTLDDFDDA
jgi:hypothetical protein